MKLSAAVFPLAILLSGCTTYIMQPDISPPAEIRNQGELPPASEETKQKEPPKESSDKDRSDKESFR